MIAALFVNPKGVYAGLPDVDVWGEDRDARRYPGPFPVVAHPPCNRWCRLAPFVEATHGYKVGDDGGCFELALEFVRTYGGVLEHPAYSIAWDRYDLPEPVIRHGWNLDLYGGASCYVEQGRYGLPVKKATWLYAYGVELPDLRWGWTPDGEGPGHNDEWGGMHGWSKLWSEWPDGNSSHTPHAFRDVLLDIARSSSLVA